VEEFMATATYQPYTEKIPSSEDGSKKDSDGKAPSNSGLDNVDVVLVEDAAKEKELQGILSDQYGPKTTSSMPASIPRLADITLTCDDLMSAGSSAAAVSAEDIDKMATLEVYNCVEYLGGLEYTATDRSNVWMAIKNKNKLAQQYQSKKKKLTGIEMHMLGTFLAEMAKDDSSYLDLSDGNLYAISVLGQHTTRLVHQYLDFNAKKRQSKSWQSKLKALYKEPERSLSKEEVVSLGRMVCGLRADEWKELIDRKALLEVLVPYVTDLDCEVDEEVLESLRDLLSASLTVPSSGSAVAELNWLMPILPLKDIKPTLTMQMSGPALRNVPNLARLRVDQLANLAPQAASLLLPDQLNTDFEKAQRTALLSSVGEDPRKVYEVEQLERTALSADVERTVKQLTTEEPAHDDSAAEGGVVGVSASACCLIICSLLYTVL